MTIFIDHVVPENPVEAQVVLHVRQQLRRRIRGRNIRDRAKALAMLFGFPEEDHERFVSAVKEKDPELAAAEVAAQNGVAPLGHDTHHVERCRQLLLREKNNTPAFSKILAFDLSTLLALSRAKKLAVIQPTPGRPPVPIFIHGPTGSGKGMLAKAIHELSSRQAKPYSVLNVSGLAPRLISTELFGYKKGAYTGADRTRIGHLKSADGGTVLLDEVGDLPGKAQVQLLRFLESGRFHRLGDDIEHKADVQIIAATWQNIRKLIKKRKFRLDLYHRICVGQIELASLSERTLEFEQLARKMLISIKTSAALSREAIDALQLHPWTGNLRELHGVLHVAAATTENLIRLEDLPWRIQEGYLRQPIELRTAGIMECAEMNPSLAEKKASFIEAEIVHSTKSPPLPPQEEAMFRVLESFPDLTGTHANCMNKLREASTHDSRSATEYLIGNRLLHAASGVGLSETSVALLNALARSHHTASEREKQAAAGIRDNLSLEESPWLRLYIEAHKHPLFRRDNGVFLTKMMGLLAVTIETAGHHAPEFARSISDIIAQGGLPGLIERGKQLLLEQPEGEDPEDEEDGFELPPEHHRTWNKKQWQALTMKFGSRQELADCLGISGTTLKKYLDRKGVRPHWARS